MSPDVPCRSMHSHLLNRWSPAPTIRQTPTTECTTRPPCYRSSCLCIRRFDSLEFTAGQSPRFDCRTGPVSMRTKNVILSKNAKRTDRIQQISQPFLPITKKRKKYKTLQRYCLDEAENTYIILRHRYNGRQVL